MKKSLNVLKISKNSLEQQLNLSKKEKMLYDNILKGKIDKFKFNLELLKIRTNFDLLKLNTEISVLSEQTSNSKKR